LLLFAIDEAHVGVDARFAVRFLLLLLFLTESTSEERDDETARLNTFFFLCEVDREDDVLCFLAMEGRDGEGAGVMDTDNSNNQLCKIRGSLLLALLV
jgi:hypothetical protein